MGVVWLAEHTETHKRVALKTVRVPDASLLRGIRREIQFLARIRHPAIVRIVADGLHNGMPWYAMELLAGTTLRHWTPSGVATAKSGAEPAPPETRSRAQETSSEALPDRWWTRSLVASVAEMRGDPLSESTECREPRPDGETRIRPVLTLVHRLCAGLAYLHGEGIVHRDLKPDNIVVLPSGLPVIVDFGLSSRFAAEASREALAVEDGMTGTIAYMAPEQIRGEPCDARTDLYALGCILYELLTDRHPYAGADPRKVIQAHLAQKPRPLRGYNPELPAAVEDLVLRLLAKDARDRIGYADTVAAELASVGAEVGHLADAPRARGYLYRPRLAGRDRELEVLRGALRRLANGTGGLILLGGESGIGKTRLMGELSREAVAEGMKVFGGEAEGGRIHPLAVFRGPLLAVADQCREGGVEETDRILGLRGKVLAPFISELSQLPGQDRYPEPVEIPPQQARHRILQAVAETFLALAEQDCVLVLLDDIQWADALSLDVLRFLSSAAQLGHSSLFLVGAYRIEEVGQELRDLLTAPRVETAEVYRLGAQAVSAIAADMLAMSAPPAAFERFVARHSEGNPFFVAEFLHLAVEEGVFFRDARGKWQVAATERAQTETVYESLPLPRSLRDLVGRRLEDLSPDATALVRAAAVVGRQADVDLLGAVTGLDERPLLEAMGDLMQRRIVEAEGPGQMRFAHDKIREVAYERIDPRHRADLHGRVAATTERLYAENRDNHLAELGYHWRAAGDTERARAYFLAAARREKDRWTLADAALLYQAYLELASEPTPETVGARRELGGSVLRVLGRIDEAEAAIGQALAEARAIADRRGEGIVLGNLAALYQEQGRLAEARVLYDQILTIHREAGNRRSEGIALANFAGLHYLESRMDAARDLFGQALVISREVGDSILEGYILLNLGRLVLDQGRLAVGRELLESALAICRRLGNRPFEGQALGILAEAHLLQDHLQAAQALHEQALAIHREVGERRMEGIALGSLALVYQIQGHTEAAGELYEQALAIHCEVCNPQLEACTLGDFASWHRITRGDLARALELAARGESLLRQLGDLGSHRVKLLCERGHVALAAGQPRRDLLDEASALMLAIGAGPESDAARVVACLRRSVEAFEAGEHERLFRGQLIEDLPEGQRRWLVAHHQLERSRAMLPGNTDPPAAP
ncbi:MAG: tetratricopeptide repeat protein [Candidatus Schekmanbacteria bacterium]|nr:tetratricopeptide repeat protein [Candidatus Schekmanbacteria bacterium]